MTTSVKLQSPAYDNDTNGSEIPIPVENSTHQGTSFAEIITLFGGENINLDFGMLKEVITVTGVLTQSFANDQGFNNPVEMRDEVRKTRTAWPSESPSTSSWDDTTLPSAEQDSEPRATGKVRLIYDKEWDTGTSSFANLFLYGAVGDFQFPNRHAATQRTRIPYAVTFLPSSVKTGN